MQGSTHGQQNRVGSASGEVIVEFTATTNDMTFDACQSDYDSYLRIYDAGLHNQIAANDDHGGRCNGNNWYASYLHTTSLQAGVTYKLVIEGYGGNHGNYQVTVHCGRGHAESEVGEAILNQGAYIKSRSEAKKSEALKAKTARQAETKLGTFIGSASKDKEEEQVAKSARQAETKLGTFIGSASKGKEEEQVARTDIATKAKQEETVAESGLTFSIADGVEISSDSVVVKGFALFGFAATLFVLASFVRNKYFDKTYTAIKEPAEI